MPEPLRGLVAIAEYGSKVEVDLAVGALAAAGIDASASYDPAMNSVAPYLASDRTFELLVRAEDADAAVARLHDVVDGLPEEFADVGRRGRSRGRERVRRIIIAGLVIWFVGVLLALIVGFMLSR